MPRPRTSGEDPGVTRAADAAALGHRPALSPDDEAALVRTATEDPDPRARAAALAALVRGGAQAALTTWRAALDDANPAVRRRAADVSTLLPESPVDALLPLLGDADVTVVVAAAAALGERPPTDGVVAELVWTTTDHGDPLAREAAAAALGALGDPKGLPAILRLCGDKPAVRRRAVLALAPFEGAEVDAALRAASEDNDWQVRQAAEDLLGPPDQGPPDQGPMDQ